MLEIQAQINERVLKLTAVPMIPSGSINNIKFILTFDSEWTDLDCTLVCYSDISNPYYEPIVNGSAIIPHEVLADPGIVCFGVFGTFRDRRITSTIDKCKIKQGAITDGLHPSEPSTDVWQYLLSQYAEIKKLTQTTLQTAESAIKIATDKAAEANTSAQTAVESAQQAQVSQEAADASAKSAADANTNAQQSATDAARSAQQVQQSVADAENAANRAEQATTDISAAVTQAQNAAQAAQQSATQAQGHAKSAGDSAAFAAQAQQGATDAETAARQSAAQAQKSQETATQAATNAGKSAKQAADAQTAAQNSAQSAGERANAAATSAQQAQESQTAAEESATSAQASAAEATKQAAASEASAVRAETAATEVEQSAQQIAGAIDRLAIHETAAGNPVVIRDGADWQMEGLRVYGQSEQVTTTGAQMFDASTRIVGGIIDNGVQASNSRYACSDYIPIPDGASHLYQLGGALNQRGFYGVDKAYLSKPTTNNVNDVPEGAKYIRITSDIDKQDMGNIMLCVGNTAKPFEPYTGGKPAPSPEYPQEIMSKTVDEIVVTGKNLVDAETLDISHYTRVSLQNRILPGVYTFSGNASTNAESDSLLISCLDTDGKLVASVYLQIGEKKSATVTIKGEVAQLQIYAARNNAAAIGKEAKISEFQIEIGSVATKYESYHAQTVKLSAPVTLRGVPVSSGGNVTINGQQYMADLITERDGVIGVERNVITANLAVSEMNNAETHPGWKRKDIVDKLKNPPPSSICNVFGERSISFNFPVGIIFLAKRDLQQSEWREKYPDLVFDIWMILAEPTFEPLPETDQQAIRALRTYHGNTVVTAGAHTEVDYVADPKLYINSIINTISEVKSKIIELESKV